MKQIRIGVLASTSQGPLRHTKVLIDEPTRASLFRRTHSVPYLSQFLSMALPRGL